MHGYWNSQGYSDRPFIYTVTRISGARSFQTYIVHAHQPSSSSTSPSGDHYPIADASLPLSPTPCFTGIASFKLPEPHSRGITTQAPSAQERFSSILGPDYRPENFPPAPPLDIDAFKAVFGTAIVGDFPIVEMRKADLSDWNATRPVHERRELIFYRPLRPLPTSASANEHILVHAFEMDRNGLLMIGNHLGWGYELGTVASLSHSVVVHVNASEAVLDGEGEGWWVQEESWPRSGAGRVTLEVKIWSPKGVHVATGWQDGLCRGQEAREKL